MESVSDFISGTKLARKLTIIPLTGVEAENLYPWFIWSIWTTRNKLFFDSRTISTPDITIRAIRDAHEWLAAQSTEKKPNSVQLSSCNLSINTKLCFIDASWHQESKKARVGWLFFDRDSTLIKQGSSSHDFVGSPFMAEVLAIMEALRFAYLMRWNFIQVNTDSQSLVKLINCGGESKELYGILNDIKSSFSLFHSLSFVFVPREANQLADKLAKSALCLSLNSVVQQVYLFSLLMKFPLLTKNKNKKSFSEASD